MTYEKMEVHLDKDLLKKFVEYEPNPHNRNLKTPVCSVYLALTRRVREVLNDYECFMYENLIVLDFLARKLVSEENQDSELAFLYVSIWDTTKLLARKLLEMVEKEDDKNGD